MARADSRTGIPSADGARSWWKRIAALVLALAACAVLRIWLIRHIEIIAKDGTIYVRMAQQWSADPTGVVRDYDYSVGYPVLISALHGSVARLTGTTGVAAWDLSAQTVSLLAALGTMAGVGVLAGRAFNWQVAGITVLLFGAATKWALLGADVVSDSPAICLQVWTAVAGLWALDCLERRSRKMLLAAALAGVCAGAGYLVRPESLLMVAIVAVLWLVWQVRRRIRWPLTLGAIVAAAATALAVASPYMIAIGGITKKKAIGDVLFGYAGREGGGAPLPAQAGLAASGRVNLEKVLGQLTEAVGPALAVLIGLWLLTAVARGLRRRLPEGLFLRPRGKEAALLVVAALLTLPLMVSLSRLPGYPSYRHMMVLAAMLSPLAAAELKGMSYAVVALARRFASRPADAPANEQRAQPAVLAALVAALYLAMVAHAAGRTHDGMGYYKQAAGFLAANLGPKDCVLSDTAWILHYSQLPGWPPINLDYQTRNDLMDRIEKGTPPPTVLVVSTRILARADQRCASQGKGTFSELLERPLFVLAREFPRDERPGDIIRIYRIDRSLITPASAPAPAPGPER